MHRPYKYIGKTEMDRGHDVGSCKAEGGQSKWLVRQNSNMKRAMRRRLKKANRTADLKFHIGAENDNR